MRKANYKPSWDISTIPDDLLRSECAKRNGLLGGRPIIDDPPTEPKRKQTRERVARWRAERKKP